LDISPGFYSWIGVFSPLPFFCFSISDDESSSFSINTLDFSDDESSSFKKTKLQIESFNQFSQLNQTSKFTPCLPNFLFYIFGHLFSVKMPKRGAVTENWASFLTEDERLMSLYAETRNNKPRKLMKKVADEVSTMPDNELKEFAAWTSQLSKSLTAEVDQRDEDGDYDFHLLAPNIGYFMPKRTVEVAEAKEDDAAEDEAKEDGPVTLSLLHPDSIKPTCPRERHHGYSWAADSEPEDPETEESSDYYSPGQSPDWCDAATVAAFARSAAIAVRPPDLPAAEAPIAVRDPDLPAAEAPIAVRAPDLPATSSAAEAANADRAAFLAVASSATEADLAYRSACSANRTFFSAAATNVASSSAGGAATVDWEYYNEEEIASMERERDWVQYWDDKRESEKIVIDLTGADSDDE
jgi:hypothetical protein